MWTREERNFPARQAVQHGDTFQLACSEDGAGPRMMSLGRGYRGFRNEISQFRQISATTPGSAEHELSELIVGGEARQFWRTLFPSDAEAGLDAFSKEGRFPYEALWIAAVLYEEFEAFSPEIKIAYLEREKSRTGSLL